MNFDQIILEIKNKIYYPVYFLCGDEPYFIDQISDYIEANVLTETEKEFNQTVIYGKDTDISTIISYAKRYPMMANYQVIIIKEAQEINDIEDLSSYAAQPLKSTILVICYKYKKVDKRKKLIKGIEKTGIFFESVKLYENKVPEWITSYLKQTGYRISLKASLLLCEYLGNDLSKITNEINKLLINVNAGSEITTKHIEENIGISKDYNIFELQKALGSRDIYKANQIINYFADNPKENPMGMIIFMLYGFFSKLLIYHQLKDKSRNSVASALGIHPFFINDYMNAARHYSFNNITTIISLLRTYDMKLKGVGNITTSERELLRELIYKIIH